MEGKKDGTNAVLKVIFISLLIDLFGFTVILPLFPSLMEFYKSNDKGNLYSSMESMVTSFRKLIGIPETEDVNSVLFGGMIGSLFSFLQFLNSPFFGAASDVYGRRSLILVSLCGSAISYVLWAMSDSFLLFLIARIVAGISEANVSISTAIIADLKSEKARSKGMAVIGVAFSIAFVFGPLVGACFTKTMLKGNNFFIGPALFSLCLTLADIVYVSGFLPETLPVNKRASSVFTSIKEITHLINPVALFKFYAVPSTRTNPIKGSSLRQLGSIYFMYLFLFSGLEFTLTFLGHHRFQFTHMDQGKMFACLGITMALVQGGYVRRKMENKEIKMAFNGMVILIPGFIVVGMSNSVAMLYAGLFMFAFAAASVVPCLSSLTATHGLESEKGRVMGILRSLGALARATGPICASASYWLVGATYTYVIGGLLLIIPLMCLRRLPDIKADTKEE
ncbi:major facilitator superfamily domain-containing protein 10-like [Styela clava]|uniref:major facilitator superfamily domain-containing protein 10-like n=1 Tax=Styela clava TaxID=7725 RepID=UPI001939F30F|nr:major facilitator superfamily domain-containing protein 10-like [Styela clava]